MNIVLVGRLTLPGDIPIDPEPVKPIDLEPIDLECSPYTPPIFSAADAVLSRTPYSTPVGAADIHLCREIV